MIELRALSIGIGMRGHATDPTSSTSETRAAHADPGPLTRRKEPAHMVSRQQQITTRGEQREAEYPAAMSEDTTTMRE